MKWLTLESSDATATLKQHCYIPFERSTYIIGEKYQGNKALCSIGGCSSDGDTFDHYDTLESESLNVDRACKTCLKIYKSNKPK